MPFGSSRDSARRSARVVAALPDSKSWKYSHVGCYNSETNGNNYCRLCKVTLADSRPGAVAFKVMPPGAGVACKMARPRP